MATEYRKQPSKAEINRERTKLEKIERTSLDYLKGIFYGVLIISLVTTAILVRLVLFG